MKKIKLNASKLKLNKETIGNLIHEEMRQIHGGYTTSCGVPTGNGTACCTDYTCGPTQACQNTIIPTECSC